MADSNPPKNAGLPAQVAPSHPIEDHDFFNTGFAPKREERIITPAILAELAASGATPEEIGGFYGLTEEEFITVLDSNPDLKKVMEVSAAGGKAVIRRRQYQQARAGDSSMLKHCGEHILGQNSKLVHAGEVQITIIKSFGEDEK